MIDTIAVVPQVIEAFVLVRSLLRKMNRSSGGSEEPGSG
jgi:hypothetical protein